MNEAIYSRQRAMSVDHFLPMVNDRLDPTHRKIELLTQIVKENSVNHAPIYDPAVTFARNPLIYEVSYLRAGYFGEILHFSIFQFFVYT